MKITLKETKKKRNPRQSLEIQKEGLCHNQFFYSIYDELYYEMR